MLEYSEKNIHIHVIDDSSVARQFFSTCLTQAQFQVSSSKTGKEGILYCLKNKIDIILLDIILQDEDGLEVLQKIKNNPQISLIPVLMISSLGEVDYIAKCMGLGAEDYIPKTSHSSLIIARIQACLERMRLKKEEKELVESYKTVEIAAQISDKINSPLLTIFNIHESIHGKFQKLKDINNNDLQKFLQQWEKYHFILEEATIQVKESIKELAKLRDTHEKLETTEILTSLKSKK